MAENEKMTYAVKFLNELVASRKLKGFCETNGLSHPSLYRIAIGTSVPTYAIICQLLPCIPVTDWFYFDGEEIPYPRKTINEWNPEDIPAFVRQHKHDYLEVAEKYGITETFARNLFVNHRARPSLTLVRNAALDGINPVEFFTEGDIKDDGKFYPERGDVVSISGKTMLVLTKQKQNRETHSFVGVTYENGTADLLTLTTVTYVRNIPELIEKADEEMVKDILSQVKGLFR